MKPPEYWRIRAACCDDTGMSEEELERHALLVTATVVDAKAKPRPRMPVRDAA